MIDSPVSVFLEKIISFDKTLSQPIYIQISQCIINAIQRGYLKDGIALPGTRILSKLLKIHRNTATAVYEEIASQGWIEIIPNKGAFVKVNQLKKFKIKANTSENASLYRYPKKTGFPFLPSFHLASTIQSTTAKYAINDGEPDLRLHPTHQFTRWYSAAMQRKTLIKKWNKITQPSYSLFRTQLSNYLNTTRGFCISAGNVLSTRSTEMILYIISQLLIKKDDIILVGQLSNYASNMIFQQANATIKTVPIEKDGLDVNYIRKIASKQSIRLVYVCAQRNYPTTYTLSIAKRLELLKLAKTHQFAIIEDDYDYDFQFEGSPLPPMASTDNNGMVIYLGKLGQSLFPSFQTGFVVAPENLITEASNYLQLLDKQGDLIQEQMLSELITEGEIYRLSKKNMIVYKQRRDYLCKLLKENFSEIATFSIPSGGLALWLKFAPTVSLVKLAQQAEKVDLFLPSTILYQNKNTCAIRFGYGHLTFEEIEIVVKKLKMAYENVVKQ